MNLPKFESKDERLWHYRAWVTRIIDGDTIVCLVDRGFGNYQLEKLRLAGIDTPELRPRSGTDEERTAEKVAAKAARDRVAELVLDREIVFRSGKAGKFGRWIATVYLPDDERTLNQVLLDEGHAEPYM